MKKLIFSVLLAGIITLVFGQTGPVESKPGTGLSFVPDFTFKGSSLTGWNSIGGANWRAENGEIIGSASSAGGWLVSNKSFQDVIFNTLFKITGNTEAGILLRAEESAEGIKGILISVKDGEAVTAYRITLDIQGKELKREKLRPVPGGTIIRFAPPLPPNANRGGAGGGQGRGGGGTGPALPIQRPQTAYRPGEWNQLEAVLDVNIMRAYLNDGNGTTAVTDSTGNYGPIALYIGGSGEARFKDFKYKDYAVKYTPKEQTSARFQIQQLSDFYYSWSSAAGDFNKDGVMDIVAGQNIFYGPDYTKSREIYWREAYSPTHDFTDVNCQYAYDFDGDGWQDVFVGPPFGRLYMNPKGESRRWDMYSVIPGNINSEVTDFRDVDGDGKPDLIYGSNSGGGVLKYATFNTADPTKPWTIHTISAPGYYSGHGIGAGDINGDGRMDILNPNGWWEQPAKGKADSIWIYHSVAFARSGHRVGGAGGSVMAVYDVNGDKLNDVVTSLNAHGFGLAWYEQKRDAAGKISFVQHMIMDDYSTKNAGGVTFSELHGSTFADVDGDGIKDFIVGKRYFSHLESSLDPDTFGPPVLYWYRTVRNPKAPGGAEFIPELIHNRSGAGSDVLAVDLNKDGAIDIITSTSRGTFIFWNKKKPVSTAKPASSNK